VTGDLALPSRHATSSPRPGRIAAADPVVAEVVGDEKKIVEKYTIA